MFKGNKYRNFCISMALTFFSSHASAEMVPATVQFSAPGSLNGTAALEVTPSSKYDPASNKVTGTMRHGLTGLYFVEISSATGYFASAANGSSFAPLFNSTLLWGDSFSNSLRGGPMMSSKQNPELNSVWNMARAYVRDAAYLSTLGPVNMASSSTPVTAEVTVTSVSPFAATVTFRNEAGTAIVNPDTAGTSFSIEGLNGASIASGAVDFKVPVGTTTAAKNAMGFYKGTMNFAANAVFVNDGFANVGYWLGAPQVAVGTFFSDNQTKGMGVLLTRNTSNIARTRKDAYAVVTGNSGKNMTVSAMTNYQDTLGTASSYMTIAFGASDTPTTGFIQATATLSGFSAVTLNCVVNQGVFCVGKNPSDTSRASTLAFVLPPNLPPVVSLAAPANQYLTTGTITYTLKNLTGNPASCTPAAPHADLGVTAGPITVPAFGTASVVVSGVGAQRNNGSGLTLSVNCGTAGTPTAGPIKYYIGLTGISALSPSAPIVAVNGNTTFSGTCTFAAAASAACNMAQFTLGSSNSTVVAPGGISGMVATVTNNGQTSVGTTTMTVGGFGVSRTALLTSGPNPATGTLSVCQNAGGVAPADASLNQDLFRLFHDNVLSIVEGVAFAGAGGGDVACAAGDGTGGIMLTWGVAANTANGASYAVYRGTVKQITAPTDGTFVAAATPFNSAASYTDTGCTPGTSYYYAVWGNSAANGLGVRSHAVLNTSATVTCPAR